MSISAVIFDMDGLMLDTEPIYKHAWQRAAANLGYDLDDDFCLTLVGRDPSGAKASKAVFGYFTCCSCCVAGIRHCYRCIAVPIQCDGDILSCGGRCGYGQ